MGADEAVLKYLTIQNRPYSANDIFMNLHKEFGKTAIQKSLDTLVEKGYIREKLYGKQKVYCIQQKTGINNEEVSKNLEELDEKIKHSSEKLAAVEQELNASESSLQRILSTPPTAEALKQVDILQDKVKQLKTKLQNLSQNTVFVSEKERNETKQSHEKYMKEWRKRKFLCLNIINSILESYPKTKKALLEDIGIETDENAGVAPVL